VFREITTIPVIRDRSVVRPSVIPSAKYSWSRSLLRLAKGSTTIERRGAVSGDDVFFAVAAFWVGAQTRRGLRSPGVTNLIDPNRSSDVLSLLLAQVFEGVIKLIANLVPNNASDANPTRFGRGFKPRRDVHPVTEDVVLLDDSRRPG
jgi:hypothetical protein